MATFVQDGGISEINVAGSRESKEPGIYDFVKETLDDAFFPKPEQGAWLGGPDEG